MASTSYCDVTSLRVALVQHAAEIAIMVLGEPNSRLCSGGELRFGNRGSLAVAIDGPKAGQWYDHEHGVGGDVIDLIEHVNGVTFREAVTYAERIIGSVPTLETSPVPCVCSRTAGVDLTRRQRRAGELWREAVPIDGTPATRYFAWRYVLESALEATDDALRFHPSCPFGASVRYPCLLALLRDIHTNEPRAIQRTALTETLMRAIQRVTFTQFSQAGGKIARMTLGPKVGTAIKLSPTR